MKANRRRESFPEIVDLPSVLSEGMLLQEQIDWLIGLRWVAVAGVCLAVGVAEALHVLTSILPPLLIAAALALANVFYRHQQRRSGEGLPRERLVGRVVLQIVVDLVALTLLLHFTGGAENPFVMFYVFHIAIAGVLLSVRGAALVFLLAALLWGATSALELAGVFPHHPLEFAVDYQGGGPLRWRSPTYMVGAVGALAATLASVFYFVTSLVSRWRGAEARRVHLRRVAMSRERLARIGSLAAGVAHAVGNPLQGLLNCVEMLRERLPKDDESTTELLDLAEESVQRIATVTKRLLVLHRDAPPTKVSQDLRAVVDDAVRFVRRQASEEGIEIEAELDKLPPLALDADRTVEALVNVLENAIDASERGGVVRVTLARAGDERVSITIADEGCGIPAELIEQVFDPFVTTKPVGRGSGLGLAIAQKAVKDHGGTMTIDSKPNEGTRVCIELPYVVADAGVLDED